jgi:mRNA interferase YafQ
MGQVKRLSQTACFKRDLKRMQKRGKNISRLKEIVGRLANGEYLDPKHRDHALSGNWSGTRDCHIEPDWVLIYSITEDSLRLERTGSHSDLFD